MSCKDSTHQHRHVLEPRFKHVLQSLPEHRLFADLQGNEEDLFIYSDKKVYNACSLYLFDLKGKIISQASMSQKYQALNMLKNPADGKKWLFYSFNDNHRVALSAINYTWGTPLTRQEKSFDSIGRTDDGIDDPNYEWLANIKAEYLGDIDHDGRMELVCTMWSGFTANPRGLVVYDFESGKIKFQYDTASCLHSVLIDDFDGDGKNEIIVSNIAFKNTMESIGAFDDHSARIAVLDISGRLLYSTKLVEGYSEIILSNTGTNPDGSKAIYAVLLTKGADENYNQVLKYSWQNGRLHLNKKVNAGNIDPLAGVYQFREMDDEGNWRLLLVEKNKGLVVFDEDLKLVPHNYSGFIKNIADVGDLTSNGRKEILIYTADKYVEVLDDKFRVNARLFIPFPMDDAPGMQFVRDGVNMQPVIAVYSKQNLYYYDYHLVPLFTRAGWLIHDYLWLFYTIILAIAVFLMVFIFRTKAWFEKVGSHSRTGIVIVNKKGIIKHLNTPAKTILVKKASQISMRNLSELNPDLFQIVRAMLASKESYHLTELEMDFGRKKGKLRVLCFRMSSLQTKFLLLISSASTPDNEDKLMWADTARRLSHHVRRQVTNVILALPYLEDEHLSQDEKNEYLAIIREEIEKIRVFTHSFQRFTELKEMDLKLQDIIPSMEHAVSKLILPANVKLIKNWSLISINARIEPIRFEEALTNLLNNALESMGNEGVLHLSVKKFHAHESPGGKHRVLVEIEDSGNGIPDKYLDEIWQPFFTTKQSGTGIGMPESRKIIQSMEGEIYIQSEIGVGTVVSLWLLGDEDE